MRFDGTIRKLDSAGRLVIPIELREIMNIEEGDLFTVSGDTDSNSITFHKLPKCIEVESSIQHYLKLFYLYTKLSAIVLYNGRLISKTPNMHHNFENVESVVQNSNIQYGEEYIVSKEDFGCGYIDFLTLENTQYAILGVLSESMNPRRGKEDLDFVNMIVLSDNPTDVNIFNNQGMLDVTFRCIYNEYKNQLQSL